MRSLTLHKSELDSHLRLDVGFNLRMQRTMSVLAEAALPFGRLEDIAETIIDGVRTRAVTEQGVPLLRVTNVVEHELDLDDLTYVPSQNVRARYRMRQGDILLTKTAGLFRASRISSGLEGLAFGSDLVRIRPRPGYSAVFLTYFLNSRYARRALDAHSYGTAIRRLRVRDIRELMVPLPPRSLEGTVEKLDVRATELDERARTGIHRTEQALHAEVDARIGQVPIPGAHFSVLRSLVEGRWDVAFGRATVLSHHLEEIALFRRLAEKAESMPSTLRGFDSGQKVRYIQLGDVDAKLFTVRSFEEACFADLPARVRQPLATGQVLLANSGHSLGTEAQAVAVVPADLDGALSTNALTALSFQDAPYYWAMCLKHPLVLAQVAGRVSGSTQPYLTKKDLDDLLLPVLASVWREDFHRRAEQASQLRLEALALRREAGAQVDRFLEKTLGEVPDDDSLVW